MVFLKKPLLKLYLIMKDWKLSLQYQEQNNNTCFNHYHSTLYKKFRPGAKRRRKKKHYIWKRKSKTASMHRWHDSERVGITTRPFRYDLNQIPYEYTVEVRNRFKGLDLIESLMNYGQKFVTLDRRQGSRPSPRKTNAKRQNGCLRRPYK